MVRRTHQGPPPRDFDHGFRPAERIEDFEAQPLRRCSPTLAVPELCSDASEDRNGTGAEFSAWLIGVVIAFVRDGASMRRVFMRGDGQGLDLAQRGQPGDALRISIEASFEKRFRNEGSLLCSVRRRVRDVVPARRSFRSGR
jgi:hypothetical protein